MQHEMNTFQEKSYLRIQHQNVRSLNKASKKLEVLIQQYKPNIFGITEHWRTYDQISAHKIEGYKLVSSFCRAQGNMGVVQYTLKKPSILKVGEISMTQL
ncbi:hypothetical protein WA026_012791 [Henosepilachna vigintioctopunctata]|uniref:Uncharacterized protein n=1 Tax=Henosepilachna vigintioctopunctata TaxID=420089 RepID=A0AAW1UB09_9CUCU